MLLILRKYAIMLWWTSIPAANCYTKKLSIVCCTVFQKLRVWADRHECSPLLSLVILKSAASKPNIFQEASITGSSGHSDLPIYLGLCVIVAWQGSQVATTRVIWGRARAIECFWCTIRRIGVRSVFLVYNPLSISSQCLSHLPVQWWIDVHNGSDCGQHLSKTWGLLIMACGSVRPWECCSKGCLRMAAREAAEYLLHCWASEKL